MKKLRKIMLAGSAALIASTTFSLGDGLNIVASFSILGDMAAQVGGDKVKVTTLVGPDSDGDVNGQSPRTQSPSRRRRWCWSTGSDLKASWNASQRRVHPPQRLSRCQKAPRLLKLAMRMATEARLPATNTGTAGLTLMRSSPCRMRIYVKNITNALCAADASNCEFLKSNASAFDAKLAVLDSDIRAAVAAIPADKRAVITSHDAFGYLAHEYGLTFHAPELSISTDSEASAADVAKLIDQIREEKASALFVENISDPRLVNQISAETGIKVGGALYSDALSAPGGPAATYIDLMRHNIATIKGAILGS